MYSEYYGEYSDYTRKGGVICSDILLPSHAPPEYADRQTLWNAVEKAERGKNAQLAYKMCIRDSTIAYVLGIGIYYSQKKNYRRGVEHGSAKWGDAFKGSSLAALPLRTKDVDIPYFVQNFLLALLAYMESAATHLTLTERGGRDVFSVVFLFEGYENHRIFPGKPSE